MKKFRPHIPPHRIFSFLVYLLAGLLAAAWFSGCAAKRAGLPPSGLEIPRDADLDELLDLLASRYAEVDSLRALVSVEVKAPKGKGSFVGTLLFQRPDMLRLKGLDLFGRVIFDLVAQDETVRIYLPGEDRVVANGLSAFPFLSGEASSPLKIADFLEVLGASGGVYLDPVLIPALEKREEHFVLHLFHLQGRRAILFKKLWLERFHFRLVKEEILDPAGRLHMLIVFEDYRKAQDQWKPFKVRAKLKDYELNLDYSEIKLNPGLTADDFAIKEKRR